MGYVKRGRRGLKSTSGASKTPFRAASSVAGGIAKAALTAASRIARNRAANYVANQFGNKRRRPNDETTSRVYASQAVSGPVSRKSVRLGKPEKHSLTAAWKHIQANDETIYYRYQGLTDYSAAQGFYLFDRASTGTVPTTGSTMNLPCYLFDVTSVPYNGATQLHSVGSRLVMSWLNTGSVGQYNFVPIPCQLASGAQSSTALSATNNQFVADNLSVAQAGPGRVDMLKWLDLRLIMVGSSTVPTTFEISLVQFTNDWLGPDWSNTTNNTSMDNITWRSLRNSFWENEVNRFVSSPITIMNPLRSKGMKRLYTTSFTINPKESTQTMAEPAHKILKIFKYMNRLQRYDWAQSGVVASTVSTTGTTAGQWPISDSTVNSTDVEPRKRVYLMLKATNQYPGDNGTDKTPSFDLVMRKCHVQPATS